MLEQHTGKFQPKPRLLDTVIEEEPESHYSVDDTMDTANQSEFMVNEESRNTDSTSHGDHQEEEHNIPEVPRETVRIFCSSYCVKLYVYFFYWFWF